MADQQELDRQEFTTLEELGHAVEYWKKFVATIGHDASSVLPMSAGTLVLLEERLTDGSKVLNFTISLAA